ncbi:MAG: outer membrane protein transport protein [Myxococcales bacterium]|nr:outer membrane protein transport protein [Myxococcales bacterium]
MLFAWSLAASAASLDLLEVGGAYGTVAATNPTALWWNPAGLAVGGGTQIMLEAAPTFGGLNVDRTNPDYGTLVEYPDFPTTYDYSGSERYSSIGVVPFLGVSSDLTVPGLGVGLGLYVPTGKAAASDEEWGASRYSAREGNIQTVHLSLGAAYRIKELVSIGLSGSLVNSRWYGNSDASVYPDLAEKVRDTLGGTLAETYQDGFIEDRAYTATLVLGGLEDDGGHGLLTDTTFTFGGGVYVTPTDRVGISLGWNQGVSLSHEGSVSFVFQCPPEYDPDSFNAATDGGTCGTTIPGQATLAYKLPSRLHLGVAVLPVERVRLELMGAWVGWHVLQDYKVDILVNPSDVPVDDSQFALPTAELLRQDRLLARGAKDSFWVGLDGKVEVEEHVTVGGRLTFDKAAIPTEYVSASNIDADTFMLQGMTQIRPVPRLGIGLSYSYAASGARTVSNSVFSQDLARASVESPDYYKLDDAVDRTFYPSTNGTYGLGIHRIGVSVQARLGKVATGGL